MSQPKFKFRRTDTIGAVSAEEDRKFLEKCFVDTGDLDVLRDCSDPRRILVGRVGSGKSALIQKLADTEERTIMIAPESLALGYVSNSTILTFVSSLGVNLDIFFRLLWRHVLTVEIIRHRFDISSEAEKGGLLDWIKRQVRPEHHTKAIDYLERWGKSFWEETDYRIKEITTTLETDISAALSAAGLPLSGSVSGHDRTEEEVRQQVVQRAQRVVNEVQIRELSEILDLLAEVLDDPKRRYYVVIDRLDENWIEEQRRYSLIRALIETVRDFHKVRNAKIVVALRLDLLRRVFQMTRGAGFQEEKYEGDFLHLRWNRPELTEVLDRRIDCLIASRYTKSPVTYRDVLPRVIGRQDAVGYMLDRTLARPRDIIMFFNACILNAVDRPQVTVPVLRQAEGEYSRGRLRSLADEWRSEYPNLLWCSEILKRRGSSLKVSDLSQEEVAEFCLAGAVKGFDPEDVIARAAMNVAEGRLSGRDFWIEAVEMFYRVGLIGLKIEAHERTFWSTEGQRSISTAEIDGDTRIQIHPAFWRVLGVHGD